VYQESKKRIERIVLRLRRKLPILQENLKASPEDKKIESNFT